MSASSIPTAEVGSYGDILKFIEGLGPPAAGRKRMFRGQTKGHIDKVTGLNSLQPALVRDTSNHTHDPRWLVSIQMYGMEVNEHGASTAYDKVHTWGPALLQHYGPGSCYLDVTSDLDVALWFALYQRNEKWLAMNEPSGTVRSLCCSWYVDPSPSDKDVAPILYVFDAAPWNGKGAPAHGELVELTALNIAGKLPEEARRLHQQVGSLLYADLKHPGGPDLGGEVVAMMRLAAGFDRASAPSHGRPVTEVFPAPEADPFYRSLLKVPAQIQCDPRRLEHPLAIPCYLGEPPALPATDRKGDRSAPIELNEAEAKGIAGLGDFAALGGPMNPVVMYEMAVRNEEGDEPFAEPLIPATGDGRQYRLKDATVFLLEGPLWSYLPGCHTEESRGEWIQSALPIGIAPELAGRPTDNVYIEMSTLDALYPQKEVPGVPREGSAVRGIWTVRSGNRYRCTVYRTAEGGIFSHAAEFRYMPGMGRFFRVAPEKENTLTEAEREGIRSHFEVIEKALFTTLLLLRDLSPGYKPPATYSVYIPGENGSYSRIVGEVLEPQLGQIHVPATERFLIPRALNGSTYARASGSDGVDVEAWRKCEEGFVALRDAYRQMKQDLFYLLDAGAELAGMCGERGQYKEGLEVARYTLLMVPDLPPSSYVQGLAAYLEVLQGRLLFCLNDRTGALDAFNRAMKIDEESGNQARLEETRNLVEKLFPPATE